MVVFDGLSVREGCFLWEQLQRQGYQIEIGYTFATLPAETSTFCQEHFGLLSAKALGGREINGFPAAYAADESHVAEDLPQGEGGLLWIGIIFFALMVIFSILTIPVEFNASRRGLNMLGEAGLMVTDEDAKGSRQMLTAAGLTYVAAAITSILQLLYYVSIARRRG